MSELAEYTRFVAQYAPLGYARLFLATGDFMRAQHTLADAFARGFPGWCRRWRNGADRRDLFDGVMEPVRAGGPAPAGEASPFSASRRVKEESDAIAILHSFAPVEQMALFLEHVEDVPRAEIRLYDLTGETVAVAAEGDGVSILDGPSFLRAADESLDRKLAERWPAEAAARERFRGILRQHALPASFVPSVVARASADVPSGSSVHGSVFRAALWSAIIQAVLWAAAGRSTHWEVEPALLSGTLFVLLLADVLLITISWNIRRSMARPDPGLWLMRGLDYLGLLIVNVMSFLLGHPHALSGPGLLLAHGMWWAAVAYGIMTVGNRRARSNDAA